MILENLLFQATTNLNDEHGSACHCNQTSAEHEPENLGPDTSAQYPTKRRHVESLPEEIALGGGAAALDTEHTPASRDMTRLRACHRPISPRAVQRKIESKVATANDSSRRSHAACELTHDVSQVSSGSRETWARLESGQAGYAAGWRQGRRATQCPWREREAISRAQAEGAGGEADLCFGVRDGTRSAECVRASSDERLPVAAAVDNVDRAHQRAATLHDTLNRQG